MLDILFTLRIEYKNYFSEIYMFICATFAYNYYGTINEKHLFRKGKEKIVIAGYYNFFLATAIYVISFFGRSPLIITFVVLITQALISVGLAVALAITDQEGNSDSYPLEEIYGRHSENRYERYLLERIDEKLNAIKSSKMEKAAESDDSKNPEELLNGSDILAKC